MKCVLSIISILLWTELKAQPIPDTTYRAPIKNAFYIVRTVKILMTNIITTLRERDIEKRIFANYSKYRPYKLKMDRISREYGRSVPKLRHNSFALL